MPPTDSHDWRDHVTDGSPPRLRCGVSVSDVLLALATEGSIIGVLARHEELTEDDVRACLAFAAQSFESEPATEAATLAPAPTQNVTLSPSSTDEFATLMPQAAPSSARRVLVPGYEVLGELGRGGMGVVYKARHVKLDRVVALKMILAGEHAGADALARFQREAEAVARLQHPGIVQIYEVGEHAGHSFIALEFVEGGSVAACLDEKPWDAQEAAALVEKVARAVHVAHKRGVVHRDLKPENILLTEQGEPKVTDFGLAKKLDEQGHTRTGDVMGTPSYMAPEQAAGKKDVGPLADVYALGGVLYRMLAGRPPFEGPTTLDVLLRVLEDEPTPLRQVNAKVPRDLETIALKCLAKQSRDRYASAEEVADELRRFRDGEPIRGRRSSPVERSWRWVSKHPGRAAAWGIFGAGPFVMAAVMIPLLDLVGLAAVLFGWLALLALLRAKPWPVVWGSAAGILVAGLTAGLLAYATAQGLTVGDAFGVPRDEERAGPIIAWWSLVTFPLLFGVLFGAVATEGRRTWLVGGALALLFVAMGYPYCAFVPILGILPAFFYGLITRLVRWRTKGGDLSDGLLGAIVGSFVGYLFGACLGLVVGGVWTFFTGNQGVAVIAQGILFLVLLVAGTAVGARIAMRASRKAVTQTP